MPKAKVVIVEDEFFAAEHLRGLVADLDFEITGLYHRGEDFLNETHWQFDVALLDIFLSGHITGLDIAAALKKRKKKFVFITANKDARTLKEAAKLVPAAYITKPFQSNDVMAAMEILAHQLPKPMKVNTSKGTKMINPTEIVFIKSDGAYIIIQTKTEAIVQRKLLKDVEDELPESFVRVHRSYLVNSDYIEKKNASSVTVMGHLIPVSRSYKERYDLM